MTSDGVGQTDVMVEIAIVGVGRMGLPVAARLVAAGNAVGVVDVRPELKAAAEEVGARWLGARLPVLNSTYPTPTVVLTVLPGSPELREAMLGALTGSTSGLLAQMRAGTLWIDMTSTAPDLAIELAIAAAHHQIHYVDAALGGGPSNAAQGTLTLYVGGEDRDVHTARSLLACLTEPGRIHHLGGHGTGYSAKLLINQLWFTQAVVFSEVLALAVRLGLDLPNFTALIEDSPAASAFARDYLPRLIDGDHIPAFGLHRVVEELDSLVRAAEASCTPWLVSTVVRDLHRDALTHYPTVNGELSGAAYIAHLARTGQTGRGVGLFPRR